MSSVVEEAWGFLYSMNPKIQAFGVCKDTEIIWQTSNWNLVNDVDVIINAPAKDAASIKVDGTEYFRVASSAETFAGTDKKQDGHILIAKVSNDVWIIGWAQANADPELALVDLTYTASRLDGQL